MFRIERHLSRAGLQNTSEGEGKVNRAAQARRRSQAANSVNAGQKASRFGRVPVVIGTEELAKMIFLKLYAPQIHPQPSEEKEPGQYAAKSERKGDARGDQRGIPGMAHEAVGPLGHHLALG